MRDKGAYRSATPASSASASFTAVKRLADACEYRSSRHTLIPADVVRTRHPDSAAAPSIPRRNLGGKRSRTHAGRLPPSGDS
jgi:hypothetical protein